MEEESIGLLNPGDDTAGWKQLHGDVFRLPRFVSLYCVLSVNPLLTLVKRNTSCRYSITGRFLCIVQ